MTEYNSASQPEPPQFRCGSNSWVFYILFSFKPWSSLYDQQPLLIRGLSARQMCISEDLACAYCFVERCPPCPWGKEMARCPCHLVWYCKGASSQRDDWRDHAGKHKAFTQQTDSSVVSLPIPNETTRPRHHKKKKKKKR